jgi:hypothetical protein
MGVDQPECGAGSWQGQPRKMVEYKHWQKKSRTFDRWAVGCNLVVLKMTCSQFGNGRIRTLAQNQAKMSIVGLWRCGLQFGFAENDLLQSGCKVQTHFVAPPVRGTRGA